MSVLLGTIGVFVGCMLNALFLELSVKADPGCGTLITFSQFLFIAIEGFLFTSKCGTKQRHIPIKSYLFIVGVFFVCNVCNNFAFSFNISMPLHMIFRSASLITNMIMGIYILKRTYPLSKYLSVILITLGVSICTIVTGYDLSSKDSSKTEETEEEFNLALWLLGLALLVFALFVSALLGIYQELLFKNYGKRPYEALYYTHLLPIPVFLIFYNNLLEHYNIMMESEKVIVPFTSYQIPCMVLYLMGNVITQYICISSVYELTTQATSLVVTLIITLRKFISLLLSIIYFGNTFTIYHWIGTTLVFYGTLIFTEVPLNPINLIKKIKID
ncbi:hypothetical protein O3M35_003820 [Rhynocoris fuscipes]|uniref:UDP-xylose and UDP-N-acetylglucosamine transporter n=1 Tax=Rhynocoris fuscipes TaxID=488301 RepID=A0AAW1CN46_9HEMI